ncbi:hypothetical protein HELRODRAFT_175133 [Helobdella robusta]|uniref:Uncharacterized protein n=1 Tax=Helobdella robusta TaxID=6412 RepID=T1F8W5_HELRO|nr:hypothetical protein HELRODRAFT_175133 [Helobdella robusta]ESO01103.1 hypothetical protein HELRODRAFT_175133 [Helobdella robusta]
MVGKGKTAFTTLTPSDSNHVMHSSLRHQLRHQPHQPQQQLQQQQQQQVQNREESNASSMQYSSFACPRCSENKDLWKTNKKISKSSCRKYIYGFLFVAMPTFFWILLTVYLFTACKQQLQNVKDRVLWRSMVVSVLKG